MHVADQPMYLAKQSGRNRAICLMAADPNADPACIADLAEAQAAGLVMLEARLGPRRRPQAEPA